MNSNVFYGTVEVIAHAIFGLLN